MGWTIQIEDEGGNAKKIMPKEFVLSDNEIIYNKSFRLLKYLDPYGDTTFNAYMFEDLAADLKELEGYLPADKEQIEEVLHLVKECDVDIHTYLKFYGD
ncbi:MAG: hypothetical protein WDO71_11870 [Bacteroidota bacterium]